MPCLPLLSICFAKATAPQPADEQPADEQPADEPRPPSPTDAGTKKFEEFLESPAGPLTGDIIS